MKTIHEYEASDIHIFDLPEGEKMEPVVAFLFTRAVMLAFSQGFRPLPEDELLPEAEQALMPMRRWIADFLNSAQKNGITIAVAEQVPEVFRS